ncbi:MAG: diaminopimelate decarboxylase [Alicycliphilus sp.]|jgi:diaminopimelate decarboxylase|uniref:Diaminopimelate decarboxylase n=1 Tax=Diaphorobacter limosus TaxID=3036128 RepID=A0ABZ0J7C0_9BURK|nr:diaminopimelate decarboxylase [Diaphorobacter sp. Y-1]MBP7326801.1 diaminopimelate decarboxylase [Alicycliphilus sp.]MBP8779472.1 diaminopimelate decarboxylase [Alicycliphilus sp.]WOO34081.1 diaminopimelate decarboxylase [Diaphorobacter sp. Y-1]
MIPSPLPGQPQLHYRDASLYLEDRRLSDLAREHGTPLYVYSQAAMLQALAAYQRGFAGRKVQICYAMKANSSLAVLQLFARHGCGFDIVSGGELERVMAAGGDPAKVIFSGVGKTRAEMRQALEAGIGCFNVESEAELGVLSEVAQAMGLRAPVSIRVNPNVDAKTHPYISTGLKGNKFGIAHERTVATYQRAAQLPGLRVVGIDCHIGSQITEETPYLDAMDRMLDLVQAVEAAGIAIQHIDFGGGLGINYNGDQPPAADVLWAKLLAKLDARGYGQRQLMIEPGRSLVGNAGVCLTEVLYLKPGEQKNFCIVDAAMNDLPRPAMYQAYHAIVPLEAAGAQQEPQVYDVVGPICESGDWLGRERSLAVAAGDLLAVLSTGAYCSSMGSTYNTRPRPAELLVDGAAAHLIRARESVSDIYRSERLVPTKA